MKIRDLWDINLPHLKEAAIFGSIYISIALISVRIKVLLTPDWLNGTMDNEHIQLLLFHFSNNEQSRFLQFMIPEALHRIFKSSIVDAYMLQRWIFTFLVFLCFHFYLKRWFSKKLAFCGVLFLAAIMPLTFMNDLQESTSLLLLTFLLAFWAIREKRFIWYMIILCIGVLNNESILIMPLVFLFYNFEDWKFIHLRSICFKTIVGSLPAYLIFGMIRVITRNCSRLAPVWQWKSNWQGLLEELSANPMDYWNTGYLFMFLIFGSLWLFAFLDYSKKPLFLKRASLMIPFYLVIIFLGGMINEARLFLPMSFLVIPMAFFFVFNISTQPGNGILSSHA